MIFTISFAHNPKLVYNTDNLLLLLKKDNQMPSQISYTEEQKNNILKISEFITNLALSGRFEDLKNKKLFLKGRAGTVCVISNNQYFHVNNKITKMEESWWQDPDKEEGYYDLSYEEMVKLTKNIFEEAQKIIPSTEIKYYPLKSLPEFSRRLPEYNFVEILHYELNKNNPNIILISNLINKGVNINKRYRKRKRRTPLHIAAQKGDLEIVKLLLDNGAKPNKKDKYGSTPFFLAAKKRRDNIVEEFLNRGIKNIGCREPYLYTVYKFDLIHGTISTFIGVNQLFTGGIAIFSAAYLMGNKIIKYLDIPIETRKKIKELKAKIKQKKREEAKQKKQDKKLERQKKREEASQKNKDSKTIELPETTTGVTELSYTHKLPTTIVPTTWLKNSEGVRTASTTQEARADAWRQQIAIIPSNNLLNARQTPQI